ncbi:Uncharacterized protein Fot_51922 [Forsythia ovata]|uniref:Uncharacterized protein n=1 Tax=Forsythia ovata TaxID=205694 RepID=A0ABD1PJ74_9LAMI
MRLVQCPQYVEGNKVDLNVPEEVENMLALACTSKRKFGRPREKQMHLMCEGNKLSRGGCCLEYSRKTLAPLKVISGQKMKANNYMDNEQASSAKENQLVKLEEDSAGWLVDCGDNCFASLT